jgi:hypothetical protein
MEFLVQLHSFWRWAVLIAAVVALVGALGGWLGGLPPAVAARRAGSFYTIALDIQFVLGLILWLNLFFSGEWSVTPAFYRFEHPSIMLLAVIVAHAGTAMARRAKEPRAAARLVTFTTLASLVLVVVGIPGVLRGG